MDAGELAELMKELLLPCSEDDVEEYMEEMDEDGSGEIDFEEFYAWYVMPRTRFHFRCFKLFIIMN